MSSRDAAERLLELFQGRPDDFAIGFLDHDIPDKVSYHPARRPLTVGDMVRHVEGETVVGIYVMRDDNTVRFSSVDLDEPYGDIQYARAVRDSLDELGVPKDATMLVFSGRKGHHCTVFYSAPVEARKSRALLRMALQRANLDEGPGVEVFPKQDELSGKGYGNLLKAPLAVHPVTHAVAEIVDKRGPVEPMSPDLLDELLGRHKAVVPAPGGQHHRNGSNGGAEGGKIPTGARNDTLFREAARLRGKGFGRDLITDVMYTMNGKGVDEPLSNAEMDTLIDQAMGYAADLPGRRPVVPGDAVTEMDLHLTIEKVTPANFVLRFGKRADALRVNLTAEEVQGWWKVITAMLKQNHQLPPWRPDNPKTDWLPILERLVREAEKVDPDPAMTYGGRVEELVRRFCLRSALDTVDAVARHGVFYDREKDEYVVKTLDLVKSLENEKIPGLTIPMVNTILRERLKARTRQKKWVPVLGKPENVTIIPGDLLGKPDSAEGAEDADGGEAADG